MAATSATPSFPPTWKLGDHWRAVMRTVAPHATVAMRSPPKPPLRAVTYSFRVIAVPDARSKLYRLELLPLDDEFARAYTLEYRRDFSLARIAADETPNAPPTAIENADQPYIYYLRHMAIVPDFPFAPNGSAPVHHEIELAHDHARLVQDVRVEPDHTHITLQQLEPTGSLRVEIEWLPGRPWWSTIECTENAPPELHSAPDLVASGALAP